MDRWDFSWDLNPGPPQKIDRGGNSSWQTWRFSSGKMKSSKISQKRCIPTTNLAYFSAFAMPLCLSASCYPSLPLQAIVLTEKIVSTWKFQSIPFIFAATFNGVIRRNLKLLADINKKSKQCCYIKPDVAQCQNNTFYIKPFRTNALMLYCQEISRHQPEKMLRSYFEYNMRKGKCDFVTVITDFFSRYYCLCTWPDLIPL